MWALRRAWWAAALAALLVMASAPLAQSDAPPAAVESPQPAPDQTSLDPTAAAPAEIEMGRQAAAEIEKELGVVDDPAAAERIVAIVERLRPHTQRPNIEYQAKVLSDAGGLNAFSLPGGWMYVTRPLLEAVESDDELAAVLAHEMAHVALAHGVELARREARINNRAALAILAAVVAGDRVDAGSVVVLASLVRMGLLSGYSQKAELEADAHAITYLHQAAYHPVAMLTVIEGLGRLEMIRGGERELGIFKTHPYPKERAVAMRRQLQAMGLPINPRAVLGTLRARSEAAEKEGRVIGRVTLDDYVIFEPAVCAGDAGPKERADRMAAELRRLLLDNLMMYELDTRVAPEQATVSGRGATIITVLPGDAEFHGRSMGDLAAQAEANIKLALWEEAVRRAF